MNQTRPENFLIGKLHDAQALAEKAADCFMEHLSRKLDLNVLVATGNTPMPMYAKLAARKTAGLGDFSKLRAFQLDEYAGVGEDDGRSLYGWMDRSFLGPLSIPPERSFRLRGDAPEPDRICREYDRLLAEAGGIDFAVLGLGLNGHLGFNEPPSAADAPTRLVALSESSRASNAAYWEKGEDFPECAFTVGMQWMIEASFVLLLVSGAAKTEILRKTLHGDISPEVPASLLRLRSKPTMVLADREAAL